MRARHISAEFARLLVQIRPHADYIGQNTSLRYDASCGETRIRQPAARAGSANENVADEVLHRRFEQTRIAVRSAKTCITFT